MTTQCPCCGQSVDTDDLLVSLDANAVSRNGEVVHLTPQQTVLAHKLNKGRPGVVQHDALTEAVYGNRIRDAVENPTLVNRVMFSQIRRKLGCLGVQIQPVYGEGYRMLLR